MLPVLHPDPLELAYQFWVHGQALCLLKAALGLPEQLCFTKRAGRAWELMTYVQAVVNDGVVNEKFTSRTPSGIRLRLSLELCLKIIPYLTEPSRSCLPYFLSLSGGPLNMSHACKSMSQGLLLRTSLGQSHMSSQHFSLVSHEY